MKLEDFKPLLPSVLAIGLAILKGKSGGSNLFQGRGSIKIDWKKPHDMSDDQWLFACSVFSHIINDVNPAFDFFDSTYREFANYAFQQADPDEMELLEYYANEVGAEFDAEYLSGEEEFSVFGHYASSGELYLNNTIERHAENVDTDVIPMAAFHSLLSDLYSIRVYSEENRLKYIQTQPRFRLDDVQVVEGYSDADTFEAFIYFNKIALLHSGLEGVKDAIRHTAMLSTSMSDFPGQEQNIVFGGVDGVSAQEDELSKPNNRETRIRRY